MNFSTRARQKLKTLSCNYRKWLICTCTFIEDADAGSSRFIFKGAY